MFEGGRALVDADSLYFRPCCRTQNKRDIRRLITKAINDIKENVVTNEVYLAVKGKGNFRQDLYPAYKATRREIEPHIKEALNYAHSFIMDKHGAVPANGMEADDLVSLWAYECMDDDIPYTICGIDKDLLQIPGWHYNFVKETHQFIDEDAGNYNLMLQCLVGDTSDNIPGLKGIGPVKARRILSGVPMQRRWNRVRAAYRQRKGGDPTLTRDLLSMLRNYGEYETIREKIKSKTSVS